MGARWTEADIIAHNAKMRQGDAKSLDLLAPASGKPSRRHKYSAEPCIVSDDLTLYKSTEIKQLAEAQGTLPDSPMPLKELARCYGIIGRYFHSTREAKRYIELAQQQRQGWISELETQPAFPLLVVAPDGSRVPIGTFTADFRYLDGAKRRHVEDVKSEPTRTEAYQLRKKHAEAQYGIAIEELE